MRDELFIVDNHAQCYEVKRLEKNNEPGLRVYKTSPNGLTIQVRTYDGIGEFGRSVKRNMIAHAHLDVADAVQLRDRLDAFINKSQ